MKKLWHSVSESELIAYFDVNPALGLKHTDALVRLKRFGANNDPILSLAVQKNMPTKVLRDGKEQQISSVHVVPGDIVRITSGDRLPADVRLLQVDALVCDQSALSGESSAVKNTFTATDTEQSIQKKHGVLWKFCC